MLQSHWSGNVSEIVILLTVMLLGWISEQPWSNGKVGMYGKSWGGFNGLMVAYQKPPALSAVISLYSTGELKLITDI